MRQIIPDALPTIFADGKRSVRENLEANQQKARLQEEQQPARQKKKDIEI